MKHHHAHFSQKEPTVRCQQSQSKRRWILDVGMSRQDQLDDRCWVISIKPGTISNKLRWSHHHCDITVIQCRKGAPATSLKVGARGEGGRENEEQDQVWGETQEIPRGSGE